MTLVIKYINWDEKCLFLGNLGPCLGHMQGLLFLLVLLIRVLSIAAVTEVLHDELNLTDVAVLATLSNQLLLHLLMLT